MQCTLLLLSVRPSVCPVRRTVCDGHLLQKCSYNAHFLTKSFISHSYTLVSYVTVLIAGVHAINNVGSVVGGSFDVACGRCRCCGH